MFYPGERRRQPTPGFASPSTLKPIRDFTGDVKKKTYGKSFESELEVSCKHLVAWNHSSNSVIPAADRKVCVPCRIKATGQLIGLSMLLEAKETRDGRFSFSNLDTNHRKHLSWHADCAGVSLVLIKVVETRPRVFGCTWHDWAELESGMGYEHERDEKTRRAAGTASISLADGERPLSLVELFKVQRPKGLGSCWDLFPFIPDGLEWGGVR